MEQINFVAMVIGYGSVAVALAVALWMLFIKKTETSEKQCRKLVEMLAKEGKVAQRLLDTEKALQVEQWKNKVATEEFGNIVFFHMMTPENEAYLCKSLTKKKEVAEENLQRCPDEPEYQARVAFFEELLSDLATSWHFEKKKH